MERLLHKHAGIRLRGFQSSFAAEKSYFRRLADKTRKRHDRWVNAGRPAAAECRVAGGPPDPTRVLYMPYVDVIARFLNCPRFHFNMTDQRIQAGKQALTAQDMARAVDIRLHSIESGQAGRVAWYLNQGRVCRAERRDRGFVTISVPRLHGDGREAVAISRLPAFSSKGKGAPAATPATKGADKGQKGKASGSGTDLRTPFPPSPTLGPPARHGPPMVRPSRAPAVAAASGAAASSSQLQYAEQARRATASPKPSTSIPTTPPLRPGSSLGARLLQETEDAIAQMAPVAKALRLETTSKAMGSASSTSTGMGPPPIGYGPRVPKRPSDDRVGPAAKRSKTAPDQFQTWWRHHLENSDWGVRYWSYYLRCWVYVNDEGDEYVHVRDLPDGMSGPERFPWEPFRISWFIDRSLGTDRYWNNNFYPYDWNNY